MSSTGVLHVVTADWLRDRLGPSRRWGGDAMTKLLDAPMLHRLRELWPTLTGSKYFVVRHRLLLALLTIKTPIEEGVLAEARALLLTALQQSAQDGQVRANCAPQAARTFCRNISSR